MKNFGVKAGDIYFRSDRLKTKRKLKFVGTII